MNLIYKFRPYTASTKFIDTRKNKTKKSKIEK